MKTGFELVGVAFLEESKKAAGLPKGKMEVPKCVNALGSSPVGSGHGNFLKGICVQVDVAATAYQWCQIQRYHWFDFVSSESKMHCLMEMKVENRVTGSTSFDAVNVAENAVDDVKFNGFALEWALDNLPQGFILKARMVTNYLQLKTMYNQRKNHRLGFWNTEFVEFCESLPEFCELTGCAK